MMWFEKNLNRKGKQQFLKLKKHAYSGIKLVKLLSRWLFFLFHDTDAVRVNFDIRLKQWVKIAANRNIICHITLATPSVALWQLNCSTVGAIFLSIIKLFGKKLYRLEKYRPSTKHVTPLFCPVTIYIIYIAHHCVKKSRAPGVRKRSKRNKRGDIRTE